MDNARKKRMKSLAKCAFRYFTAVFLRIWFLGCLILWIFGRNFGASTVQGFAYTLAIGVMISMFTAVFVTRTLVRIVMGRSSRWLRNKALLIGV